MKAITTALIVLSVMTAGSMVGPFPKTRRNLKSRRCRKVIVSPPLVCPEIPPPPPTPEKLKTPKPSKSFIEKLINISIKDLLKTLIMTIVSLVAKVLFEKRTFQTKVIQFVASFLRLIMTIGGYAATDVLSVCILATIKSTFSHLLYKVLLVRSYRIILKHNFKYLLSLGITKMKESQTEARSWDFSQFFHQTLINRFSVILREIFIGHKNTNANFSAKKIITKKQKVDAINKLNERGFNLRMKSQILFDGIVHSKMNQRPRSKSLDQSNASNGHSIFQKAIQLKDIPSDRRTIKRTFPVKIPLTHNFTNYLIKDSIQH